MTDGFKVVCSTTVGSLPFFSVVAFFSAFHKAQENKGNSLRREKEKKKKKLPKRLKKGLTKWESCLGGENEGHTTVTTTWAYYERARLLRSR